jgi:hypothetical protein
MRFICYNSRDPRRSRDFARRSRRRKTVKIHPAKWGAEYGAPLLPQIEEVLVVPEPLEHYSIAQAKTKTEKQAPRRQRYVIRARPNFFEKLVIGFINLQKHQPAKSSGKRSRTTSRRG